MPIPRKERDQSEEGTGQKSDPALQIKSKQHPNQPAPHHQIVHAYCESIWRCLPSRPQAQPAGTKLWASSS